MSRARSAPARLAPAAAPTAAPWKARRGAEFETVRARLVDAAEAILREEGPAGLRQEAVAARAGLSRSSVYRYVDSKDELVLAAVVQSTTRIGRQVIDELGDDPAPEDLLVRGVADSVRAMAADPLHRALTVPGTSRRMSSVAATAFRTAMHPLVAPALDAARRRGVLRDGVTEDDLVTWLQVVALGLLASPRAVEGPDHLERLLRQMLVPAVLTGG